MKTEIKCSKAGCDYDLGEHKLDSDNFTNLISLLQVHVNTAHPTGPAVQQDGNSNGKPQKTKRPEMSAKMSEEDWEYFLSRWEQYKIATKLTGKEAVVIQLMECAIEQLRPDQYRTYGKGDDAVTEQDILAQFKALVKKKNNTVNCQKLSTMKQEKGEPVRKFFGRLRGVASVCGYTVSCNKPCCNGHQVPYHTQVIKEQLIKG